MAVRKTTHRLVLDRGIGEAQGSRSGWAAVSGDR
jgi:hypothetical protein